jgi:FlaA1/EpsC-like NDP-sugar epimerase
MDRMIIFGTGKAGRLAYEMHSADNLIVAFADNDPKKINQVFLGCGVVSPDSLPSMHYDRILIASIHWKKIEAQLLDKGLDKRKISVFMADAPLPASALIAPHLSRIERLLELLDFGHRKSRIGKDKVIIFGAGSAGKGALEYVHSFTKVICIIDNDTAKHGKAVDGIEIRSPSSIASEDFDYVVIAGIFAETIRKQLLSMGIIPLRIRELSDIQRDRQGKG